MDPAALEREKNLLPFGWGRFAKSITLAGGLRELTKTTNLLLAATDRRLLLIPTGTGGAPRDHSELPMLPPFEQALQRRLAG